MQFDLLILCLIGTALLTAAATFFLDAALHLKRSRASRSHLGRSGTPAGAEAFPRPIAHGYPLERPVLPRNVIPINRTARAQAQLRISGAAMSEMRSVLGELPEPPARRDPCGAQSSAHSGGRAATPGGRGRT